MLANTLQYLCIKPRSDSAHQLGQPLPTSNHPPPSSIISQSLETTPNRSQYQKTSTIYRPSSKNQQPPHSKCAPSHHTSSPTATAPKSPQARSISADPPPAPARNAPNLCDNCCRSVQEPVACANKRRWRERRRRQRQRCELGDRTVSSMEMLSQGKVRARTWPGQLQRAVWEGKGGGNRGTRKQQARARE